MLGFELWSGVALFFSALLLVGTFRLALTQRPQARPTLFPAIAILRPCAGSEPELLQNLASALTVPYPGKRRVLLLCPGTTDPAYPVLERVVREAPPHVPVEILLTRPEMRHNRKVAQLCAGLAHCTEPVVVCADSDVRLLGDDLTALVSRLCAPPTSACTRGQVGAVFASPVEQTPRTPWDRASSALVGGSTQNFMALYGLYRVIGGVPSMAGALLGFSREALCTIGGFSSVAAILGEDYELSRRLCHAGYSVEMSSRPAHCSDGDRSARAVIARVSRWLTVVRAQRPGLLFCYPIFMAATPPLLLALLWFRTPLLAALTGGVWVLRTILSWFLRRTQGIAQSLWVSALEVLGAEALLWAGLALALWTRQVTWRGYRFRVVRGGQMVSEP